MEQKTGVSRSAPVPNRVSRRASPLDTAKTAMSAAGGMCDAPPALKCGGFLGYACLSPTTLAPKGSVRAQHEALYPMYRVVPLDSLRAASADPPTVVSTLGAKTDRVAGARRLATVDGCFTRGKPPLSTGPTARCQGARQPYIGRPGRGRVLISFITDRAEAPGSNRCLTTATEVAWLAAG
jgi:hypothetical protein